MRSGMLWFDADQKKTISQKIIEAFDWYSQKYGIAPNTAYINPRDFKDVEVRGITVYVKQTIMPNHVWIGVCK